MVAKVTAWCFRPLAGIEVLNWKALVVPHQPWGIVSVPFRGLGFLTYGIAQMGRNRDNIVYVPLRGLGFLTA